MVVFVNSGVRGVFDKLYVYAFTIRWIRGKFGAWYV